VELQRLREPRGGVAVDLRLDPLLRRPRVHGRV
jgi:hypothetical protein